jgi:hypothetical protein
MLLGLMQLLQSEKKIKKKISTETLLVPALPRGFKFIHKNLQT